MMNWRLLLLLPSFLFVTIGAMQAPQQDPALDPANVRSLPIMLPDGTVQYKIINIETDRPAGSAHTYAHLMREQFDKGLSFVVAASLLAGGGVSIRHYPQKNEPLAPVHALQNLQAPNGVTVPTPAHLDEPFVPDQSLPARFQPRSRPVNAQCRTNHYFLKVDSMNQTQFDSLGHANETDKEKASLIHFLVGASYEKDLVQRRQCQVNLGVHYADSKDLVHKAQARRYFELALEGPGIDPKLYVLCHHWLGNLIQEKDPAAALVHYRIVSAQAEDRVLKMRALFQTARIRHNLRDYEGAAGGYRQIIYRERDASEYIKNGARYGLGILLLHGHGMKKNIDAALPLLFQAMQSQNAAQAQMVKELCQKEKIEDRVLAQKDVVHKKPYESLAVFDDEKPLRARDQNAQCLQKIELKKVLTYNEKS